MVEVCRRDGRVSGNTFVLGWVPVVVKRGMRGSEWGLPVGWRLGASVYKPPGV